MYITVTARLTTAPTPTTTYQLQATIQDRLQTSDNKHVLAILGLSATTRLSGPAPQAAVAFTDLEKASVEVWTSNRAVTYAEDNGLTLAYDGETLSGAISYDPDGDQLDANTFNAYRAIFDCCERMGYPHLFRMWNFVPDINGDCSDGLERYRAFCKGRARAFFDDRHYRETFLPAGTGVGPRGGPVTVMFMSAKNDDIVNMENPRQMPAYHYPADYGPKSPSFARGTLVQRGDAAELYVSGTSSIIGHETVHQGDVAAQTRISLENIEKLIEKKNLVNYGFQHDASLRDLENIKVFVRHQADLPAIREICTEAFHPEATVVYLGSDICRADLLVEIEGVVPARNL